MYFEHDQTWQNLCFQMIMKQRHFIRHPASIPIDVQPIDVDDTDDGVTMMNLSQGGLAFKSHLCLNIGSKLCLKIPSVGHAFLVTGHVAWVEQEAQGYTIGVVFTDKDEAYLVRMVEQVCHIQSYWQQNKREGRNISIDQAASEWIERFASNFP